jgi:imidazolonepropionase
MWDVLFTNVHLATMADGYGEIRDAAIAVKDGRIAWLGRRPAAAMQAVTVHDGGGCWLTPGLIDCHTHIVHAGNRSDEFEARLNGATYEDIARAGGGIMSTVRATRAAAKMNCCDKACRACCSLLAEGVTTSKSNPATA